MKLHKLEKLLLKKRKDYFLNFNEGLDSKEIEVLEMKYKIKLPKDIIELYMWRNGQGKGDYSSFINNSMFMELEEVLEIWSMLTGMIDYDFEIKNWWNKAWLPIFTNGSGSYICYDTKGIFTGKEGQMIEFWRADDDRNVIAPSLEFMINQLIKYYEESNYLDEYIDVEYLDGYPKEFIVK